MVSTGAADDFEKATALARMTVTRFGMTDEAAPIAWDRRARQVMGFTNVIVMIPFCRTPDEADRVLAQGVAR
ncbi:MAG TPA: hypothetical protein VNA04_12055 [Thermoanaerobaculia bacterium]|nr:hypothetical protein [Thermoanaerobaculia bacterium]